MAAASVSTPSAQLSPIVQFLLDHAEQEIDFAERFLTGDPEMITILEEAKRFLPFFRSMTAAKAARAEAIKAAADAQ